MVATSHHTLQLSPNRPGSAPAPSLHPCHRPNQDLPRRAKRHRANRLPVVPRTPERRILRYVPPLHPLHQRLNRRTPDTANRSVGVRRVGGGGCLYIIEAFPGPIRSPVCTYVRLRRCTARVGRDAAEIDRGTAPVSRVGIG